MTSDNVAGVRLFGIPGWPEVGPTDDIDGLSSTAQTLVEAKANMRR